MAERVTTMVLEVDLQCPCCYKKVKKLLCKFPQIRGQVYDEKKNTVTITVICYSPEKIRDKLCCKGGKVIKSIEIKPEKPPAEKPVPAPVPFPQPKASERPDPPVTTVEIIDTEPPRPPPPSPPPSPPKPRPTPPPLPPPPPPPLPHPFAFVPVLVPVALPLPPAQEPACCGPCSKGQGGGPCYHGYGGPQPCYDNYGYGPYCRGRPYYVSRCDEYLNDENTSACKIM